MTVNPSGSTEMLTLNSADFSGGTVTVGSLGVITTTVQSLTHNDNAIDDATINDAGTIELSSAFLHLDDDIINNVGGTLGVIGTAPSLVSLDNTTVIGSTLFRSRVSSITVWTRFQFRLTQTAQAPRHSTARRMQ